MSCTTFVPLAHDILVSLYLQEYGDIQPSGLLIAKRRENAAAVLAILSEFSDQNQTYKGVILRPSLDYIYDYIKKRHTPEAAEQFINRLQDRGVYIPGHDPTHLSRRAKTTANSSNPDAVFYREFEALLNSSIRVLISQLPHGYPPISQLQQDGGAEVQIFTVQGYLDHLRYATLAKRPQAERHSGAAAESPKTDVNDRTAPAPETGTQPRRSAPLPRSGSPLAEAIATLLSILSTYMVLQDRGDPAFNNKRNPATALPLATPSSSSLYELGALAAALLLTLEWEAGNGNHPQRQENGAIAPITPSQFAKTPYPGPIGLDAIAVLEGFLQLIQPTHAGRLAADFPALVMAEPSSWGRNLEFDSALSFAAPSRSQVIDTHPSVTQIQRGRYSPGADLPLPLVNLVDALPDGLNDLPSTSESDDAENSGRRSGKVSDGEDREAARGRGNTGEEHPDNDLNGTPAPTPAAIPPLPSLENGENAPDTGPVTPNSELSDSGNSAGVGRGADNSPGQGNGDRPSPSGGHPAPPPPLSDDQGKPTALPEPSDADAATNTDTIDAPAEPDDPPRDQVDPVEPPSVELTPIEPVEPPIVVPAPDGDADAGIRLDGEEGQNFFAIGAGSDRIEIENFGGVGEGANGTYSDQYVDTLVFDTSLFPEDWGEDCSPIRKMIVTQVDEDLRITFAEISMVEVVLIGFSLTDLDNLPNDGAATGNIAFADLSSLEVVDNEIVDGERQVLVEDSFDVFNTEWGEDDRHQVFQPNHVTFLNDQRNVITGWVRQGDAASDDVINAQGGDDVLYGLDGHDWLRGEAGDDELWGDDGDDTLVGGSGNDVLVGGTGNDVLSGGTGTNQLTGGAGHDRIHLGPDAGTHIVSDFQPGEDQIVLRGGLAIADLAIAQDGADTVITISQGGGLVLTGVNRADVLMNRDVVMA